MKRTLIAAAAIAAGAAAAPLMAADYYYYPAGSTIVTQQGYAVNYYHDQATIGVVQQRLLAAGYNVPVNGILDARTIDALKHFQQVHGFAITGSIDQPTMAALGISVGGSGSVGSAPVIVAAPVVASPVLIAVPARSHVDDLPRNYDGSIGNNHGGLGFDGAAKNWAANY